MAHAMNFLFGLFFIYFTNALDRLCVSKDMNKDSCLQLPGGREIECDFYTQKSECLLDIKYNRSNMAKITAQEAYLAVPFVGNELKVCAELIDTNIRMSTVILVNSTNYNGDGFQNLRGFKYCHPGFNLANDWISRFGLEELENEIINLDPNYCKNDTISSLEQYIASLSTFFGDSCRAGPWTEDPDFDKYLKSKYPSLCNLCPGKKCAIPDYSFSNSLKCISNKGDIALTTYGDSRSFFSEERNVHNIKYLCKNGTTENYSDTKRPCMWTEQMNDLIVVNRDATPDKKNLKSSNTIPLLLGISTNQEVTWIESSEGQTLTKYTEHLLKPVNANTIMKCGRTIKWCTHSPIEQRKCEWLSQSAINRAIKPVVTCVQSNLGTELGCLKDIQMKKADLVSSSVDSAYIAYKKQLVDIAYAENTAGELTEIIVLVKSNDSSIKGFESLRGKHACFPVYAGIEWLTFVDFTKNIGLLPKSSSDYGVLLQDFIGPSCAPGAKSTERDVHFDVDVEKFCEQCVGVSNVMTAKYCNDDEGNKYYKGVGALNCLLSHDGDFAVVDKNDLLDQDTSKVSVLCKNGSLVDFNKIDGSCHLNVLATGSVIARKDDTRIKEYSSVLTEFSKWFGGQSVKPFNLFSPFNRTKDVLFDHSISGLTFSNSSRAILNYQNLISRIREANVPSTGYKTGSSLISQMFIIGICACHYIIRF